ncbi:hypothetical protein K439DRAFT_1619737 [Ramaria rubella]|nr:hypothetical protein K439DRAFT_1619737 [Ramaria rubella]
MAYRLVWGLCLPLLLACAGRLLSPVDGLSLSTVCGWSPSGLSGMLISNAALWPHVLLHHSCYDSAALSESSHGIPICIFMLSSIVTHLHLYRHSKIDVGKGCGSFTYVSPYMNVMMLPPSLSPPCCHCTVTERVWVGWNGSDINGGDIRIHGHALEYSSMVVDAGLAYSEVGVLISMKSKARTWSATIYGE